MSGNNFIKELKRRKVPKAAVTYIAVSWVILQAASILFPAMQAPEPAMRYMIITLILLFPVWIIFAWIYDYTPVGIRKTDTEAEEETIPRHSGRHSNAIIISSLVLAVALLLMDRIFNISGKLMGSGDNLSVAVLPFENNGSEEDAYFADGISEDILTQLGKIHTLRVLSRFTLKEYNSAGKTPNQIGKELNVAYLLGGSIRRVEDQLRIGCQLISTEDESETWSETYDRVIKDVFSIQSEVAKKIATKLRAELSVDEKERIAEEPTENLLAYQTYLKGREKLNMANELSNDLAIQFFKQAIVLDDQYALSWAGLADAYRQAVIQLNIRPFEYLDSALHIAKQAVDLNDNVAETWHSLGAVQFQKGNWPGAKESYRLALEKSPNFFPSASNLAKILTFEGELVEAVSMLTRSIEIHPMESDLFSILGNVYRRLGMNEKALQKLNKAIELDPDSRANYYRLAFAYTMIEESQKAESAINKYVDGSTNSLQMAAYFMLFQDPIKSKEFVDQAIRSPDYDPRIHYIVPILKSYIEKTEGNEAAANQLLNQRLAYHQGRVSVGEEKMFDILIIASIHCIQHENEECIQWLSKAVEAGEMDYQWYLLDPIYSSAREDTSFQLLMESMENKVDLMRQQVLSMRLD